MSRTAFYKGREEQGDPLMPMLYALRQHRALVGNASDIGRERVRVRLFRRHSHGDQPSKSGCGACRRGVVVVPCPHQLAPGLTKVWNRARHEQRIPWVDHSQRTSCSSCGSSRANFWLRALRPEDTESFARRHDKNVCACLRQIPGTQNAPHTLATLASQQVDWVARCECALPH